MPDYPNPATPIDPADHPATNMPSATEDYWRDKPAAERPFSGTQKSNIPDADTHPNDPWNKSFKAGDT